MPSASIALSTRPCRFCTPSRRGGLLAAHYCQSWQHLPGYGAYHATLIADPALPGKWQVGKDVANILVFEGDIADGANPEEHDYLVLPYRLIEALPIPVSQEWAETLWEAGIEKELIAELTTGGYTPAGFRFLLTETVWSELLFELL